MQCDTTSIDFLDDPDAAMVEGYVKKYVPWIECSIIIHSLGGETGSLDC